MPTKLNSFLLITVVPIMLSSSCKQNINDDSKNTLQLTASIGGMAHDTTSNIYIATTIFNPTDDTVYFVTMTCSYEDMFLTDNAAFKIQPYYDCYSNVPIDMAIPPHAKLDQFIQIQPLDYSVIDSSKLKIGMYFLNPGNNPSHKNALALHNEIGKLYENRQQAPVIWSNELDLRRLHRKVYYTRAERGV